MYKRLLYFVLTYLLFALLFTLETPLFLLYHGKLSAQAGFAGCLQAAGHGIAMNLSVAGYFSAIPGVLLFVSVFFRGHVFSHILKIYFLAVSAFISLILIADLELYSFWRFRIDASVLAYIASPTGVVAGISLWKVFCLAVVAALWTWGQFFLLNRCVSTPAARMKPSGERVAEPFLLLTAMGLMFIAVRGGVTASTMSVGKVYFSENMYLNHAATNPVFSILSSITKVYKDFDKQYNFMPEEEATAVFRDLMPAPSPADSLPVLLKTSRPNIVLILLESFGAKLMEPLGGLKGVTPNLNRLSGEGLFFRKMY
ncbi:MAG: LTA synthase family protein, partial [Dysgonamonadaceae bacterium]|nr:LTA synthase family protein [Dysgonamonadaceae bacterium]